MLQALSLNSSYEFLGFRSATRALVDVYKGRAVMIEAHDKSVSSVSETHPLPAVIVFKKYAKVAYDKLFGVSWSKDNVKKRDNFTCQYCGNKMAKNNLTVDHVIPQSKGGLSNWDNTVASCWPCNKKKKTMTLEQANMRLLRKPKQPRGCSEIIRMHMVTLHEVWMKYLHGYLKD